MIPDAAPGGLPRKADKREIVEAILYMPRAGCTVSEVFSPLALRLPA